MYAAVLKGLKTFITGDVTRASDPEPLQKKKKMTPAPTVALIERTFLGVRRWRVVRWTNHFFLAKTNL